MSMSHQLFHVPGNFLMDALRAVLELALKDKALSFEARRQLVAAEASAYADAASVVQGKANAAATALAVVNLKDTMKAGDRRQYDDGYAESIAELMSEFEVQPRMVRKLVLKVLRAHTTVPEGFDIEQFVRVPFLMLRIEKQVQQIKFSPRLGGHRAPPPNPRRPHVLQRRLRGDGVQKPGAGGLGAVWRAGVLRHGGDLRPRRRRLPRPLLPALPPRGRPDGVHALALAGRVRAHAGGRRPALLPPARHHARVPRGAAARCRLRSVDLCCDHGRGREVLPNRGGRSCCCCCACRSNSCCCRCRCARGARCCGAVSAGAAPALLRARGGNEITVVGMQRWSQEHTEQTDLLKVCLGEE